MGRRRLSRYWKCGLVVQQGRHWRERRRVHLRGWQVLADTSPEACDVIFKKRGKSVFPRFSRLLQWSHSPGVFARLVPALVFKTSGGCEQRSLSVRFRYTPACLNVEPLRYHQRPQDRCSATALFCRTCCQGLTECGRAAQPLRVLPTIGFISTSISFSGNEGTTDQIPEPPPLDCSR